MLAPIVLFVYNRPEHTRKTLESLMANELADQSTLFIYADGPKDGASAEDLEKIKKTREVIREKKWCNEVNIVESEKNKGLANSIIRGVSEIINKFGKIIVLEDDLILSKHFLSYMNSSIEKYEKDERVMQISGYTFPINIQNIETDALFLPFTSSWGWSTWKRSWDLFDREMGGIKALENDGSLRNKFDLNGSYPYYKMLLDQKRGLIDSWAIRFYLSVFLKNGLVLYPKKTLVNNDGFDGSGQHCKSGMDQGNIDGNFMVKLFPADIASDEMTKQKIVLYLKNQNNFYKRIFGIIVNKIKKYA